MDEKPQDGVEMEEQRQREPVRAEEGVDLGAWFSTLRKQWWKISCLSLAVGVATLLYLFTKPNLYKSSAVIMPAGDEGKQNPAFGALASMGLAVGGPSRVEDLDILFKSNDLTVRVFNRHDHWPALLGDAYDNAAGTMRVSRLSRILGDGKAPKPPGDWDAVRYASKMLTVTTSRRSGSLTLSFESPSAQESAAIVKDYLDEAKNRLQEEAVNRATRNKKFIEEQIARTPDPMTRDRLYTLYGQEVEREMMARNREQFGFRIIDSPRVPDRKSKPQRAKTAVLATILAAPAWTLFFGYAGRRRETVPRSAVRDTSGG